jgi:LPLT family lysophospholipid transporter-like MFS transporter
MSAQFFSSLADNALFVAAVELLRTSGAPEWQRAALVPMFALFYVCWRPSSAPSRTPCPRAG